MKSAFLSLLVVAVICGPAAAATKYLTCSANNAKGTDPIIIEATIADESDEAEVRFYSPTAKCAPNCKSDVYRKEVLPTVIRLSYGFREGDNEFSQTLDVNRTTLAVSAERKFTLLAAVRAGMADTGPDDKYEGTCKVRVDESKKIL